MQKKNSGTETTTDDYIGRAAAILKCLSSGRNELTDIAKFCKLSKSTVHRLLLKLIQSNMAMQDPTTRRYYVGPLIAQLSSNPQIAHQYLIAHALEEMERLSNSFGETVALDVMVGLEHIRLFSIPGKYELRIVEGTARLSPLFKGAATKVLISQFDDKELQKLYTYAKSKSTNGSLSGERHLFFDEVDEIRRHGYAITRGERIPGVLSASARISNYAFPADLAIIGLEERLETRVQELIQQLTTSANNISNDLAKVKTLQ